MKTAVIQMNAGGDKSRNVRRAGELVRRAISAGARFILLPEVFVFRGRMSRPGCLSRIVEVVPGESLKPLMALARKHKIFILAGSIYEKAARIDKAYNTSVFIDDRGAIRAKYRKIHLFEAVLGKKRIKESDYLVAGNRAVVASVGGFRVGLSVCYDVRFPELYREYARRGVHAICVPSAFAYETGKAHWEVLLRARAIENCCYVLAPNQIGLSGNGVRCYGHSMIIGPWGDVLAEASGGREEIIYAQLNLNDTKAVRQKLPALVLNERIRVK
ncbi:MAG: carbon-nitrogen hydrolase family protein [Candidatus Omnitrophica bacterium]|nr:carbon-nitrogen hydrolase family protein [Candidatus Omnitrophota bacterium]